MEKLQKFNTENEDPGCILYLPKNNFKCLLFSELLFHGVDLQIDANNLNLELIMKISTFGLKTNILRALVFL